MSGTRKDGDMVVPELAAETTKCNAYTILSISVWGGALRKAFGSRGYCTAAELGRKVKKSSCFGSTVPIAATITMGLSEAPSLARLPSMRSRIVYPCWMLSEYILFKTFAYLSSRCGGTREG